MEIKLKGNNYGHDLIIEADNVKIVEDVEKRTHIKAEDGTIFKVDRDINSDHLDKIAQVLDDMIYYRKAEYDSSELIKRLFEKLPESKVRYVLDELNFTFGGML